MPRWSDINPEGPVTQDSFLRFEAVAGYQLPDGLRELLETANGGYAEPSGYVIQHPDGRIDVRQVDCFLALHGNHWDGDVEDAYEGASCAVSIILACAILGSCAIVRE